MKTKAHTDHLRWVALLLATAVILPTVCLLWFMMQAVRNERLAVRQKFETFYTEQCKNAIDDSYIQLCLSMPAAEGLLVFDTTGKPTFPVSTDDVFSDNSIFDKAFTLEFQEKDYAKAIEGYQAIRHLATAPNIRIQADISTARCLDKADRLNEAIEHLDTLVAEYADTSIDLRIQKSRAYLLLVDLMHKNNDKRFEATLAKMYDYVTQGIANDNELLFVGEPDFLDHAISSELQAFVLSTYLEYAENLPVEQTRSKTIKWAQKLVNLLDVSMRVADDYRTPSFIKSDNVGQQGLLFSLETEKPLYGRHYRFRNHTQLMVFTPEYMASWLNTYVGKFQQLPSLCRIYDEQGRLAAGSPVRNVDNPFIKMPLSGWLPGWTAHLFVEDITFDSAADKQAAVYLWTGLLVVVLFLASGGLTAQMIGRQIRMNRLKNDFIATVTHELKTPLSSMRLLVDTLLDGGYTDPKQCREYLEMICRENHRLSRMIDSFLTFSRMERGKQVFEMQKVAPADIAQAAAEAVQAKFHEKKCRFTETTDTPLPSIIADKDAMVTVLVNLLDNACKYSGEDKDISLHVFSKDGSVCFSVTDNGIGMTRRQVKKIFDKFYQVDTSLARRAEGCGLGLSIVKYILDAHQGRIDVESKPGKGSVFTVRMPKN
jgi:signal transduction histidine kinase